MESAPSTLTSHLRLRPVEPGDYGLLNATALSPGYLHTWRYRGSTPSPDDFVRSLWSGVLCQFIAERRRDRSPVGLLSAYNVNHRHRWCYVAFMAFPEFRGTGLLFEGVGAFIDYLFRTWDLRKLYAEVLSWNLGQFSSALGRFVTEEARLIDHEWHDGIYVDLHVLAIRRDDWNQRFAPIRRAVFGSDEEVGPGAH